MNDSFLSQEEIDALLRQNGQNDSPAIQELTTDEKDALGEIGNISMGSAATTLSQLINQKVTITTPRITLTNSKALSESFNIPYLLVEIKFTRGIEGSNVLVMQVKDASLIADLMMGGDGSNVAEGLSEISASAVAEAMNQMMGAAATAMSTIFNRSVVISPPEITPVDFSEDTGNPFQYSEDVTLVVVSFALVIGELVDSEIMQVIPIQVAKEQAQILLTASNNINESDDREENNKDKQQKETVLASTVRSSPPMTAMAEENPDQPRNLDLILDVPLRVSVVLGRTKKPIKEVLRLTPGAIVELEKLVNEPVEILVNGTLIAHGEVVVINENFGVRLTHIVSARERLNNLLGDR